MNNSSTKNPGSGNKPLWILSIIIISAGLFFTVISLSEFIRTEIGGDNNSTPWGSVNDNPWYYESPTIYSRYNLVSGLLFAGASILTTLAIFKKQRGLVIIGNFIILLFLLADFLSARIQ